MFERELLVFADDWGRHASSCQHLLRRLQNDYRILWVNSIGTRQVRANGLTLQRGLEKLHNWGRGLTQVAEQMWVIDLPMLPGVGNRWLRYINRQLVTSRLRRELRRLDMARPTILTTLPYMSWLIRGLPRSALVYYCTDDYSHWPGADRQTLQQADRDLSREADLILAASEALYEQHAGAGRCEYFPHGVDCAHFAQAQEPGAIPEDLASLPRPRIGFFGLIYEKLDFQLLTGVAKRCPNASVVMIGPVTFCPPEFAALPNVHLLGKKLYEQLPAYIAGLDVLLLPYVKDDPMIRQSGPLKLRECLASGKATVSVDVPEVRAFQPHVRIGVSQEAFIFEVGQALKEGDDPSRARARQERVAQDGWDRRADGLRSHLALLRRSTLTLRESNGKEMRPRILHLRTVCGRGGGPEKTLLNSPRFLSDAYRLRLAYIRPEGDSHYDMPERAREMGADLIDIPERGPADPRTLWRLMREVREFPPDILHGHDYKTNVLAVVLGRAFRIPVMTTLHGYVTRGGRLEMYYSLDRWALRQMDHIVAVSEDLQEFACKLGVPHSRCSLIENGIDAEQCVRRRPVSAAKANLGINPNRLVLGAVGRLAREKGFTLLIRAVHELLADGYDAELLIVGEGEQRTELEDLIAELGRQDRIRLVGHRRDLAELYEAMDIFVLSSLREGLPNVVLEAMAMEVPVLATRVAGIPRLIEHGQNGVLVAPGELDALVHEIKVLLDDRALRSRLADNARQTVLRHYSFQRRMDKIRALYDRLTRRPA